MRNKCSKSYSNHFHQSTIKITIRLHDILHDSSIQDPLPGSFDQTLPASITSMPSLGESFVSRWAYADLYSIIDPHYYGNICTTSTIYYRVNLLSYIHNSLEQRKITFAATLVDFRKAFDLVDHDTAINKADKSLDTTGV